MSEVVYLAARFEDQLQARKIRDALTAIGVRVVAGWLEQPKMESTRDHVRIGVECYKEVIDCQTFMLFNPKEAHRTGTGGRHVEFGIAFALGKNLVLIGERENSFHHAFVENVFPTIEAYLFDYLKQTNKDTEWKPKTYKNNGKKLQWGQDLSKETKVLMEQGEVFTLLGEDGAPWAELLMDSFGVIRECSVRNPPTPEQSALTQAFFGYPPK